MTAFLGVLYLLVFLAAGCTRVRFLLPQKSVVLNNQVKMQSQRRWQKMPKRRRLCNY